MITLPEIIQTCVELIIRAERAEARVRELEAQITSVSQDVPVETKKD